MVGARMQTDRIPVLMIFSLVQQEPIDGWVERCGVCIPTSVVILVTSAKDVLVAPVCNCCFNLQAARRLYFDTVLHL